MILRTKLVSVLLLFTIFLHSLNTNASVSTSSNASDLCFNVGDWTKYEFNITGGSPGTAERVWIKYEFLSVGEPYYGTKTPSSMVVNETTHWPDGREEEKTMNSVDYARSVPQPFFGWYTFVVNPQKLKIGESVYNFWGYIEIAGETTRTYAGASRTLVHGTWESGGTIYWDKETYYWDKQTGILLESVQVEHALQVTRRVYLTETSIWQGSQFGLPINATVVYVLAAVIIVGGISVAFFLLRRRRHATTQTPVQQRVQVGLLKC